MDQIDLSKEIDLSKAIQFLGDGAFCEVHLVQIDGRRIAVKTLKYTERSDLLAKFKEECEILVKLDHPNIITTICGSEKVRKYQQLRFGILAEWCEMGTLRELIFNPKVLYSMRNVTLWSENLFHALDYMFKAKRIIHRDINTGKFAMIYFDFIILAFSILVTKDFIVKLGDFGTTKEIDQTCSGTFDVGTPRYLSPPQIDPKQANEELEQSRKNSSRNDVYALGLAIWQLIERRLVFAEYGAEGKFDHGLFIYDVYLRKLKGLEPPKCPSEFREIVEDCCNFDRSKRPNIEEALKRIQEFKKSNNLNGSNDGYPTINENQQELIRPIGFDHLENRELISVTSHSSGKIADWLSRRYISFKGLCLLEEFNKGFDQMSNHDKMGFNKHVMSKHESKYPKLSFKS